MGWGCSFYQPLTMINEDAGQKSDSGEKFNGSSQRRKRPRKVTGWNAGGCLQKHV